MHDILGICWFRWRRMVNYIDWGLSLKELEVDDKIFISFHFIIKNPFTDDTFQDCISTIKRMFQLKLLLNKCKSNRIDYLNQIFIS